MEYSVTIAIPDSNEDHVLAIFDALVSGPDPTSAVGHMKTTGGPSDYTILVSATDAHAASEAAVATFRAAVASSGVADAADATIIDLHAELVPDEELAERTELQPA